MLLLSAYNNLKTCHHQPKKMDSTADAGPSAPALPSDPRLNHALRMQLADFDGEMAELLEQWHLTSTTMTSMADTGPSTPALPSDPDALRVPPAEIDGEVAKLQTRLYQVARARVPIVKALRSIVYPVLALPPEITAEIFLQYVAEHPLHLPDSYTNLSGPPLLASICRAWRQTALNLQVIWSNITVGQIDTESLLQCCLARAGGSPLTLDMDFRGRNPERLFTAAAQYCMQWETFSTCLYLPLTFPMDQVKGRIPRLRKLSLTPTYVDWNNIGTTTPITAFCEAPQLREVELDEISLPLIPIPWAQLTHLTCVRINVAQVVEMLLETIHLEELTLHWLDKPSSDAIPVPLPLPSIRALVIADDSALDFFGSVTLPALEILDIYWSSHSKLPQVLHMFARSGCRLHSISLCDAGHSFSLPILEAMPTASKLHLFMDIDDGWSGERDLIPFLKRLATDTEFLPNLQTLSMEWNLRKVPLGLVEMLHEELVKMLESRRYQRTTGNDSKKMLESFTLWWIPDEKEELEWNPDLLRRSRVLVADGLELDLPGID
ncbi:hypothetical protein B0H19DRAFT_1256921 [Mycena capillaripes]|nr:hypothetical protein B0H19DRAFT_1256921 [Mycena capillaripes]